MYSRVAFYVGQAPWEYKSANPGKVRLDMRAYFKGMGEERLRMFIFLSGSSTEVIFTEEQWKEHTERFRTCLLYTSCRFVIFFCSSMHLSIIPSKLETDGLTSSFQ